LPSPYPKMATRYDRPAFPRPPHSGEKASDVDFAWRPAGLLAITPVLPKSHKFCKRCSRLLCIDELIIRTPLHVFHCDCFRCIHCSCILKPGDRYVLLNEFPLCLRDLPSNSSTNPLHQPEQPKILKPFDPSGGTKLQTLELITPEVEAATDPPRTLPGLSASKFMPVSLDIATTVWGLNLPVSGDSQASHRNPPSSNLTSPPRSQHLAPQPPPPPPSSAYLVNEPINYFLPKFPPPRRNRKRRGAFPVCLSRAYDDTIEGLCLNAMARQKRIRTSFKHGQLRAMKAFFATNHNPDGKDLKGLSERTGLSKRVLQVSFVCYVWFQNARAKFRRSVLRTSQNCLASLESTNTNCSDSQQTSTALSEPTAVQCHEARLNQSGDDNLSCVLSDETRTVNSEDPEALERFALNDSFLESRQDHFPNVHEDGGCDEDVDDARRRPRLKPREENEFSGFFGSSPIPLPILNQGPYA
uniref:LIM/homeobox protein Lhx9 n=1 Tax=Schistocephalus solidus TaxID=70667 RepID=A0A183TMQ6_SCHSO